MTTEQAISELQEQVKQFSDVKNLHFKWTVSKGRDTYGYNICTLLVDGEVVGRCNGGGYDMQGTAFGEWIQNAYQDKLRQLFAADIKNIETNENCRTYNTNKGVVIKHMPGSGFYGVTIYWDTMSKTARISLDGACGFNSIQRIAEAIGITLQWNKESDRYKNHSFYTAFVK